jgi:DNA-binding MarR family transcriptional regulator
MAIRKNVQDTHISKQQLRTLHDALISIMITMNTPQRDVELIEAAGIKLDRALFPLLVGIERRGPIGVVDLADGVGRDHTTVSRQVAKLESLGLVERRPSEFDARVRLAVVSAAGKAMTEALDAARERKARAIFASWAPHEVEQLVALMPKFAAALAQLPLAEL